MYKSCERTPDCNVLTQRDIEVALDKSVSYVVESVIDGPVYVTDVTVQTGFHQLFHMTLTLYDLKYVKNEFAIIKLIKNNFNILQIVQIVFC